MGRSRRTLHWFWRESTRGGGGGRVSVPAWERAGVSLDRFGRQGAYYHRHATRAHLAVTVGGEYRRGGVEAEFQFLVAWDRARVQVDHFGRQGDNYRGHTARAYLAVALRRYSLWR